MRPSDLEESRRPAAIEQVDGPPAWAVSKVKDLCEIPGSGYSLRGPQLDTLAWLAAEGGAVGAVPVGGGKSLIGLLSGTVAGAERPVIICPKGLVDELIREAIKWDGIFNIHKGSVILPYSILRSKNNKTALDDIRPDLMVLDEARALRSTRTAQSRRVTRAALATDCPMVVMDGSFVGSAISNLAVPAGLALGDRSPVPRGGASVIAWDAVTRDPRDGVTPTGGHRQLFSPLMQVFGKRCRGMYYVDRARESVRNRLRTAPGVVFVESGYEGSELVITLLSEPKAPPEINAFIKNIKDTKEDLNGAVLDSDEIKQATSRASRGYWLRWVWPESVSLSERYDWRLLRSDWTSWQSTLLTAWKDSVDSPYEVRALVDEGEGPEEARRALFMWRAIRDTLAPRFIAEGGTRDAPATEDIWISRYLIDDCIDWLKKEKSAILWYSGKPFERELRKAGLTVYGAGEDPPRYPHSCAMSIRAHGVGLNLQETWHRQRVSSPPATGEVWEQLAGRTHREGQPAKIVELLVDQGAAGFRRSLREARKQELGASELTGQRRKLTLATYKQG